MSENEIQESAAETATDSQAEATAEVTVEETAAPVETTEAGTEVKAETAETTEPAPEAAAPAEPEVEEEPEEISYHAVEKEGEITAIWEMQGRKHIRTISARSNEGTKILSLFTSEIHETDSPAMGNNAAAETTA